MRGLNKLRISANISPQAENRATTLSLQPDRQAARSTGKLMTFGPDDPAPIDVENVWAELAAMGAADFLPEGIPNDPPAEPDPSLCFDD